METIRRALEMFRVPVFYSSSLALPAFPQPPQGGRFQSGWHSPEGFFSAMSVMCMCIDALQSDFLFPTRTDQSCHLLCFPGSFLALPSASDTLTELNSLQDHQAGHSLSFMKATVV